MHGRIEQALPSDNDDIDIAFRPLGAQPAQDLAQPSSDPVAANGIGRFFGYGQPKAWPGKLFIRPLGYAAARVKLHTHTLGMKAPPCGGGQKL